MISFDPPPNGFSSGEFYTAPLRVYFWDEWYWVYDQHGFLCSTDKDYILKDLLVRQAERPQPGKPYGARDHFFPEAALARIAKQAEGNAHFVETVKALRPTPKPVSGLNLKDLGL